MATGEHMMGLNKKLILHLNGNSNDSSGGAHNGTDTAITYVPGKFGQRASFNGTSSKIVIGDHADLKPTGAFTAGFWINTTTTSTSGVFQSWSANTAFAGFRIGVLGSGPMYWQSGKKTGTTGDTDYKELDGSALINDGKDHLVVCTWDTALMYIYINGNLDASVAWANAPAYDTETVYQRVGCYCNAGTDATFFAGKIDELFLINGTAWGIRQIKDYYAWAKGKRTAVL